MSTNDNPIRILSDFTEEVKTYVVSSGGRLLDSVSTQPQGGLAILQMNEDAELAYVENDASNTTALVKFFDENTATIAERVYCPAGSGVSLPVLSGAVFVGAIVDPSDTGTIKIQTS